MNEDETERNRRSVYVFVRRNTRYPMFETFDMPDTHESCPRRNVTTGPLQALTVLNSKLTLEWAQGFAGRVIEKAGAKRDAQIETAFRLALSREPDQTEKEMAQKFFDRHREIIRERRYDDQPLALPAKSAAGLDPVDGATLVDFEVTSQPGYFTADLVHLTRRGNTAMVQLLVESFSKVALFRREPSS